MVDISNVRLKPIYNTDEQTAFDRRIFKFVEFKIYVNKSESNSRLFLIVFFFIINIGKQISLPLSISLMLNYHFAKICKIDKTNYVAE